MLTERPHFAHRFSPRDRCQHRGPRHQTLLPVVSPNGLQFIVCARDNFPVPPRRVVRFVLSLACALAVLGGCKSKAPSDREIWAEVDGEPIFRDEVEKFYHSRLSHGSDSQITVSEAEVDKKVSDLQSPYSKEEFQGKLAEQGLDATDLRQQVR